MTKYLTVKREAKVGEKILITESVEAGDQYRNGDVLTVTGLFDNVVDVAEHGRVIYHHEYEVIVGEQTDALTSTIKDMQAQIDELKAKVKALEGAGRLTAVTAVMRPVELSDQQRRDQIVEQAKTMVADVVYDEWFQYYSRYKNYAGDDILGGTYAKVEFVINRGKRTVAALVKSLCGSKVMSRGIAKCDPSDCFNAHIGKAIALRRALGLEVPAEYLNAPQPTEARVGDIVSIINALGSVVQFTAGKIDGKKVYDKRFPNEFAYMDAGDRYGGKCTNIKIIDDTREEADA